MKKEINEQGIFRFSTEEQLNDFDKKYNYSGVFSGNKAVWIYGEGTDRWFSIQHCGNRWFLNKISITNKNVSFSFYPKTHDEFINFIESKIN